MTEPEEPNDDEFPLLPDIVKSRIQFAAGYIGADTTDWLRVKRQIYFIIPKYYKGLFSKKHFSTKKQIMNKFEEEVIRYWKTLTGVTLFLTEDKIHDPNWVQRTRSQNMKEYNAKRKQEKLENQQSQKDNSL